MIVNFLNRSLIECASLCALSNSCLVFRYTENKQICEMGNGQGLQAITETINSIAVHVKDERIGNIVVYRNINALLQFLLLRNINLFFSQHSRLT